jgi:hypothetical protein
MSRVSCLLIAFSRLEGISRLLSSLNPSEIETVYLAIDGPTSDPIRDTQAQIITAVRSYCATNSVRLVIWQRDKNFGVAKSIISAIDWFFTYEEFGIILEDDLLVGEDFVDFVVRNQHLLENDDVLLISGDQFDHHRQLAASRNWTTYPLIWGWATSRKKWKEMRHGIIQSKPRLFHKPFNKVENFWRVGTLRVRSRQIDTWDIPLVYFMLQNRKLCLTPEKNLISNLGNDQFASHTGFDAFPLNLPIERLDRSVAVPEPNAQHTRNYDSFLEKNVFQIRKRHAFLYIFFVISSILGGKRNWKKLAQDLEEVDLP